jgi:hypothetical protein
MKAEHRLNVPLNAVLSEKNRIFQDLRQKLQQDCSAFLLLGLLTRTFSS